MHGSAWPSSGPMGDSASVGRASPLLTALFLVFAALVLLRVTINPLILDIFVNYTSDSGSIFEKLHPTIYGFAGLGLLSLLCFRIALDRWEVRVVRAMLAFLAGIGLILVATAAAGRGGSAGYLIDTYATACCAALMFLFPRPWRRGIGHILVAFLALSAMVALVEFVIKTRFLPFNETEYSFRPIGLASHPLELGLWMAVAIGFCAATRWSLRVRAVGITILIFGLGASGARTALMIGLSYGVVLAVASVGAGLSAQRRLEWRIILTITMVAAIPLLIVALYGAGALDRFKGGIVDANARARVDIYGVFEYMSWSDIFLGMDPMAMRKIAKIYLNLEFVESSIVIFVTLFGLLGTVFFVGLFAYLLRVLLTGAKLSVILATMAFFVIALSSNGLSTKGAGVFTLIMLIIAFRPCDVPPKQARG